MVVRRGAKRSRGGRWRRAVRSIEEGRLPIRLTLEGNAAQIAPEAPLVDRRSQHFGEDLSLHTAAAEASVARKRRKREKTVAPSVRLALLQAIVEELHEHGRAGMKDHDAVLVRVVARTGLSRIEIQEAAAELLPLLRALAEELRREAL